MAIASTGVGEGLMEIAAMIAGIAVVGMIINRADQVNSLLSTGGSVYGDLLQIATSGGTGGGYGGNRRYG